MHRRWSVAALALLLAGCSSRCGAQAAMHEDAASPTAKPVDVALPLPANAIPVPLVRQKVNYSCGNVAALSILRYWDPGDFDRRVESDLYAPMHTTSKDGTDPLPIVDYIAHVPGLSAELKLDAGVADLTQAVDRGEPTIVDIQAWKDESRVIDAKEWEADWDDGHYAVLVGYDERELYFMDPSTSDHYAYIPRGEFEARWHDVLTGSNAHIVHAAIFIHGAPGKTAPHPSTDATPLR